jgi:hypothetical protein
MGNKRADVKFEPFALSVQDAAKFSCCGEAHIWNEINKGKLDVRKDGRRTLVLVESLKARILELPRR